MIKEMLGEWRRTDDSYGNREQYRVGEHTSLKEKLQAQKY
jgi:hypothetical protein